MLAVALTVAVVAGRWPLPAVAGLAAVGVVSFLLCRLDLVVGALAAGFYFNAYLDHGAGLVTIDKAVGALAVTAWALDWAVNRRRVIVTPQFWLLGGFLAWTLVSLTMAVNMKAALVTTLRYLIFATLFVLVVQTVRGERRRAAILIHIVVAAAAVAAVIGLAEFFTHHVAQASGPLKDPNDFGFLLASTLPLGVYEMRWAGSAWARPVAGLAVAVTAACTVATFSRSALTGLAAGIVWALLTRRLRLRWFTVGLVGLGVAAAVALAVSPRLIHAALGERAHVATANVDERLGYYRVELNEWQHYPLTGVGPGNFVYRFYEFAPGVGENLPYPSNVLTISGEEAYLVILAEQGAVGLALFLCYLALSWSDLRRRFPADQRADQLQAALAAGFIVACVGALFLAEQYYPPLWFLPALGAALVRSPASGEQATPPASVRGVAQTRASHSLASGAGT